MFRALLAYLRIFTLVIAALMMVFAPDIACRK
jgi:hypothetical protein